MGFRCPALRTLSASAIVLVGAAALALAPVPSQAAQKAESAAHAAPKNQADVAEKAADSAAKSEEHFTPSHLQAAWNVIVATDSGEGFDQILPIIADKTRTLFIRSDPALAREIESATMDVAIDLAKRRTELNDVLKKIWARRFTEAELNQIVAFFQSDVGKKFAQETPVIAALSVGASKQWSQEISNEMVKEVRAKLKAEGHVL